MRAVNGGLPYDCMTRHMVIELGKYVVMMIHDFQPKSDISRTYSPHTIMAGNHLDFKNQLQCHFGNYV